MLDFSELGIVSPELAVVLFALIRNGFAMGQYYNMASRENR